MATYLTDFKKTIPDTNTVEIDININLNPKIFRKKGPALNFEKHFKPKTGDRGSSLARWEMASFFGRLTTEK